MITGKLNWDVLAKLLKNNQGALRPEVERGGSVGEDCAVVNLSGTKLVLSTDPVTAAANHTGRIAYHINLNDIATTGAKPLGILVTVLAPPQGEISDIETVMAEISEEAKVHGVMILGGHTEVTDAVNRMVVSITALGVMDPGEKVLWTAGAEEGNGLLVTKALALEGTAILAQDFPERCREVLTEKELDEAKAFARELSVLPEGRLMRSFATAMHDITEGGILGALWEMKTASGLGFEIEMAKLPLRPVTRKLCAHFQLDPLRLISSGSMLMAVKDPEKALAELTAAGIEAHLIGRMVKEGGVLLEEGRRILVDPPARDEIYKLYDVEEGSASILPEKKEKPCE